MPLDEKQKEHLLIGGTIVAVIGLFVALKKGAGSSVAGQSLASSRAPTPGGPGYNPNAAANDLGKAYLDYQFKNQQLTTQNQFAMAQLASTDARAKLAADTQLAVAKVNANSKLDSALVGPVASLASKALDKYAPGPTPTSQNPTNGTNNSLPSPYPKAVYGWTSPDYGTVGYGVLAPKTGSPGTLEGVPGYNYGKAATEPNTLAKDAQVFGPPSAPATPGVGYPSINSLVGNGDYQTSPIVDWLTGKTYEIPYESPASVTPTWSTPFDPSWYFSAPDTYNPSFENPGSVADLGNGGAPDSSYNDVGFEGGIA